jgi:hypothetical protein
MLRSALAATPVLFWQRTPRRESSSGWTRIRLHMRWHSPAYEPPRHRAALFTVCALTLGTSLRRLRKA